LRIVGRGPTLSRSLTLDEATEAMAGILAGHADPAQVGALLLLLRYRGETPEELAGFAAAARQALQLDLTGLDVTLDWPSYADRHRQQPWFLLSARLLAQNGIRILVHGVEGATGSDYASTRPALAVLGITPARDRATVASDLAARGLAYVGLEDLCPAADALLGLRPLLGVRTVVNSFVRALNPAAAPAQMQGVFHPPYRTLQAAAAQLLGQPQAAVFKGGGGEAQRNPLKACAVAHVVGADIRDQAWPALLPETDHRWREEDLAPGRIQALWQGDIDDAAPVAAVTGTAAIALALAGRADTPETAQALAERMWRNRLSA
jgi:anthranilate phosphoribosyltransferase